MENEQFELVGGSIAGLRDEETSSGSPAVARSPGPTADSVVVEGVRGSWALPQARSRGHASRRGGDALSQASRFGIVAQTYEGATFEPPKIYAKFGSCKMVVGRRSLWACHPGRTWTSL